MTEHVTEREKLKAKMWQEPEYATFARLRSGQWGIRGRNLVRGQSTTAQRRDGTQEYVRVERVIWRGDDGITLAMFSGTGGQAENQTCYCGPRYIDEGDGECMVCGGYPR